METAAFCAVLSDAAVLTGELQEEKIMRNAPGGYYIPTVEQVDAGTMKISFTPSKLEMAAIGEQLISLPSGKDGSAPTIQIGSGIGTDGRTVYSIQVMGASGYGNSVSWHDGEDGITPHIGDNGNWYLGNLDTGMPSRGEGSGGAALPAYWQTHVDSRVEEIRQAMEAAGRNRAAFLFYTDAHWESASWTSNSQNSPTILKYLSKYTPICRTFFGGDIVAEEADDRQTMEYLWQWRAAVRDLPNHHSVPGNHDDGNAVNNRFSEKYVYAFLQAAEETADIVRGEEGLWYYLDSPSERTRYLCMDTAYQADLDSQGAFFIEALNTTPAGWHIVAISHIWLENQYNDDGSVTIAGIDATAAKWLELFDAYNARGAGSMTLGTAANAYDFGSGAATVEFCIGGHTHVDNVQYASDGGIPVITVESDGHNSRSGLASEPGTVSEQSVNAVIADYEDRVIHIIRIGRGASYDVELAGALPAATNWIRQSVDFDGEIFNGTGYMDGAMVVDYAATDISMEYDSSWITGLMPIEKGDVVRIFQYYNKEYAIDNTDQQAWSQMIQFFNSDKSLNRGMTVRMLVNDYLANGYSWDGTGTEGTFTFEWTGTSSMFTNAKWFRLSGCRHPEEADRLTSIAKATVTINQEG